MKTKHLKYVLALVLTALLLPSTAFAHETQIVEADGVEYKFIVGFSTEPAFTNERNGLDLSVRLAEDDSPVANLENGLRVTIVSPDGLTSRRLTLRGVWGKEGAYTADFVLTREGAYEIHIEGFVGASEINLVFTSHDVESLESLRFP